MAINKNSAGGNAADRTNKPEQKGSTEPKISFGDLFFEGDKETKRTDSDSFQFILPDEQTPSGEMDAEQAKPTDTLTAESAVSEKEKTDSSLLTPETEEQPEAELDLLAEETAVPVMEDVFAAAEQPEQEDTLIPEEDTSGTEEEILAEEEPTETTDAEDAEQETTEPVDTAAEPKTVRMPKYTVPPMVRIAGTLALICCVIALLLAVVNAMTEDAIAENQIRKQMDAVLQIFPEGTDVEPYEETKDVYLVYRDGAYLGYCASVMPMGYIDAISMMVGVTADGAVAGIQIVNMSETPGVGTGTRADSFLSQFIGLTGTVTLGDSVDGIAGATISSRAVTAGVNAALALEVIPTEKQPETTPPETDTDSDISVESAVETETEPPETTLPETETDSETTPPETTPPETESPETLAPETTPPETLPPETTPPETLPPETTPPETIPPETLPPETTPPETLPPETTPPETTPPETEADSDWESDEEDPDDEYYEEDDEYYEEDDEYYEEDDEYYEEDDEYYEEDDETYEEDDEYYEEDDEYYEEDDEYYEEDDEYYDEDETYEEDRFYDGE